ncbi:unnamed protein product [Rotaria sp. Silwood1]|nr:unnamed protein product [Rotaria sp. Silwood1]
MSSSSTRPINNRTRVKLYTLNEERQWDDRGTGFVTCLSPTLSNTSYSIIVKSEIDGSILLESKIQLHTNYQKQQETLIVWSEGEKYDLALSFQEKAGCDDIWENICDALATHGILNVIQVMLSLDDITTKQAALDVFTSIVECNPSTVREYMLQETQSTQDDDELLLNLVISEMQSDPDPELSGALNLMNYFKLLIDPENMIAVSIIEKTEFLSFFYFRSMSVLLAPLMANTIDLKLARDDFHQAQLQYLILDFLTFCIEHHTYHIRNFLQKKDLLRRILVLLKSKHQYLQLSALRFLRKIIGLKDEQYNLIIVRNNLFASIVDAYKTNKRRYNLLNSAMIELFEFIRQENIKTLINYFVENFYSDFESITYVKTFHDLKLSYNQRDKRERILSDSSPTSSTSRFYDHLNTNHILSTQRLRKDERDLDVDEENWFNDDIDENKISSLNHSTLFNDGSDDDDSQPEIASAISTSEPLKSHHSLYFQ